MSFNDNIGPVVSSNSLLKTALYQFGNQFNVGHLNCQSIRPSLNSVKFDELKSILCNSLLDVVGISETWLKSDVSSLAVAIPGYKLCRNDRSRVRGGGVGIYVSSKLKHKIVFKTSVIGKCESLFVELESGDSKVLFGVVYLPPPGDLTIFEDLHHDLFSRYSNIVVVGDFNCNLFNISRANVLRSLCIRLNLAVVHNSAPTHFDVAHGSTSLIDFMLVSDSSMRMFSSQVQCPAISHHALIFASFRINIQHIEEFIEYRDFNNINWDGLLGYLEAFNCDLIVANTNIDEKCNIISSLVERLYSFVPIVRRKIRFCDEDWINSPEIVLARSLRDLAYSDYLSNRTDEKRRVFCKYRNRAKSVIRKCKRNYYARLFYGLDSKGLWRILKNSGLKREFEFLYDGDVNIINDYFSRAVGSGNSNDIDFSFDNLNDNINSFSFSCVNGTDVLEAFYRVKSKCVGVDGISVKFFKIIYPYISGIILNLINSVLMTSIFPSAWKTARVVPIPKSDKISSPDDLRPISLLPVLSKVVEHIMKEQMLSHVNNTIFKYQYAFRKGHNTTSLLLQLTDAIRHNINSLNVSVLVSLDLTKAFNSICYMTMIRKLNQNFNFSRSACNLIMSYLSNRSQFVDLFGVHSNLLGLVSGVPQGSVLGPLLFVLYVNDFSECINSNFCKTFLFADDVFLLFNFKRSLPTFELENVINDNLNRILLWTNSNSLFINPSKTKAMLFGSANQFASNLNIFVENSRVEFVSHHRCLGVILDNKLSFENHINCIHSKLYVILRRIYSTNVCLPFKIKCKLAHALLMPQILYGIELISGSNVEQLLRLNRAVNVVTRFVYKVRRREHISEFVKRFLGCSFANFVEFRNLFLFYKVIKSGIPLPLCNNFSFSHSSRRPQIIIPRIYNSSFEKSFVVRIARTWNQLPNDLRLFAHSNNVYRFKLFEYFSLL